MSENIVENPGVRPSPGEVTLLLASHQKGDSVAAERLLPLVYKELRHLAAGYMRHEKPGHTLQPTALVHEAYIRLIRPQAQNWKDRAHFLGIAARVMRQILVEHARCRGAEKRGGGQFKLTLDEALVLAPEKSIDLLALDEALHALEELDRRQCQIVELRFFSGLSIDETAEALGISPSTVKQEWAVARVWLHRRIFRAKQHAMAGETIDSE
jgi:RNA polymerase sigma-70 factor (ECF subfamily)